MTGYILAEEAAERWDISRRQVQRICEAGRIEGAIKFGPSWAIPKDAKKPTRTAKSKPGRKTGTHKQAAIIHESGQAKPTGE